MKKIFALVWVFVELIGAANAQGTNIAFHNFKNNPIQSFSTGKSILSQLDTLSNMMMEERYSVNVSDDSTSHQTIPSLTTRKINLGEYVHYTIQFQNTGADTAFNVVIADTLNSLLDLSTFQVLGSSHPCKVKQLGNVIYFEFLNIQLPENSLKNMHSSGFVSYSVSPLKTIPAEVGLYNNASIYFDYTNPVISNPTVAQVNEQKALR